VEVYLKVESLSGSLNDKVLIIKKSILILKSEISFKGDTFRKKFGAHRQLHQHISGNLDIELRLNDED
jgi:hypothetical protein